MDDPGLLILVAVFLFGAAAGSFLNVVIYRLPLESCSIAQPARSFCPKCKKTLPWYENVPIVSFLLLRGKCSGCGLGIPIRYPLVEALTAALFLLTAILAMDGLLSADPGRTERIGVFLVHLYFIMVAVSVTFIDLDHRIIPDEIDLTGAAAAPILCAFFPLLLAHDSLYLNLAEKMPHWTAGGLSSLAGIAVGGGTLIVVRHLGRWVFKKEAMGMGDVKYLAFMGGFFGWGGSLMIFLTACLVGAVIGLVYQWTTKRHDIPFGPFLSLGMLIILFLREQVHDFIFKQWPEFIQSLMTAV